MQRLDPGRVALDQIFDVQGLVAHRSQSFKGYKAAQVASRRLIEHFGKRYPTGSPGRARLPRKDRMANYTIKNLREAEDMAPKFGLAPDMEARFPSSELGLEATGLSLQRLAPDADPAVRAQPPEAGGGLPGAGGKRLVQLDDEIVELRKWDAIRISPEVTRAVSAGPGGMEYLAFGASEGSSAAEDAQAKPGWWDGAGAGV